MKYSWRRSISKQTQPQTHTKHLVQQHIMTNAQRTHCLAHDMERHEIQREEYLCLFDTRSVFSLQRIPRMIPRNTAIFPVAQGWQRQQRYHAVNEFYSCSKVLSSPYSSTSLHLSHSVHSSIFEYGRLVISPCYLASRL